MTFRPEVIVRPPRGIATTPLSFTFSDGSVAKRIRPGELWSTSGSHGSLARTFVSQQNRFLAWVRSARRAAGVQ